METSDTIEINQRLTGSLRRALIIRKKVLFDVSGLKKSDDEVYQRTIRANY